MVRTDAHQVFNVALKTVPKIELGASRALFHEHRVAISRLSKPIDFMFRAGSFLGFKYKTEFGARKRRLAKIRARARDGQIKRFTFRQNTVAQVELECLSLA